MPNLAFVYSFPLFYKMFVAFSRVLSNFFLSEKEKELHFTVQINIYIWTYNSESQHIFEAFHLPLYCFKCKVHITLRIQMYVQSTYELKVHDYRIINRCIKDFRSISAFLFFILCWNWCCCFCWIFFFLPYFIHFISIWIGSSVFTSKLLKE